jgi:hypothetical protein
MCTEYSSTFLNPLITKMQLLLSSWHNGINTSPSEQVLGLSLSIMYNNNSICIGHNGNHIQYMGPCPELYLPGSLVDITMFKSTRLRRRRRRAKALGLHQHLLH